MSSRSRRSRNASANKKHDSFKKKRGASDSRRKQRLNENRFLDFEDVLNNLIGGPHNPRNSPDSPKSMSEKHELEDGEVPDDDQEEHTLPVCRFFQRNSCSWGSSCRYRHPGDAGLGNYVMFEQAKLPLPLPPCPEETRVMNTKQPPVEKSFDSSLKSLRRMMQKAGYKVSVRAARQYKHQPWVEFNDMDTDPYYTQQPSNCPREASPMPPALCHDSFPEPYSFISFAQTSDWRRFYGPEALYTSGSSTTDYSSTTDSETTVSSSQLSSGIPRKRKHLLQMEQFTSGVSFVFSSSSGSEMSSYASTTHSSELSSSAIDSDCDEEYQRVKRRCRTHGEPPVKSRRISENAEEYRSSRSKLKIVQRKLATRRRN